MNDEYITRDIYLASYLFLSEFKLINRQYKKGLVYFIFDSSPKLKDCVMKYHSGNTKVEPVRFIETIRRFRKLIQDTI